jgi:hypothetical protein
MSASEPTTSTSVAAMGGGGRGNIDIQLAKQLWGRLRHKGERGAWLGAGKELDIWVWAWVSEMRMCGGMRLEMQML